jgi:exosortase
LLSCEADPIGAAASGLTANSLKNMPTGSNPRGTGLPSQDLASKFALLALTPAWLAMGWLVSKTQWFWTHQPELQFGWIVLMLCAYLFWEAWERRPQPLYQFTLGHFVLVAVGAILLFLVQIYQAACGTNSATTVGLAVAAITFAMGNIGYVFGSAGIRHFVFAFAFLLIALPMPSVVHNLVVGGLQSKITALNVEILNVIGIPAQRVGSLIRLPSCTVGVDEACSGIRSLQSTLMATLFIGHLTLRRKQLQLLLVMAGVLLAVFGNLVRSLLLSYTANAKGIRALESLHDTAGWSILLFTAIGVALVALAFARLERISAVSGVSDSPAPKVAGKGQDPALLPGDS